MLFSGLQWSVYDEIVHCPSVNPSYVMEFSFFEATAFPWLTRCKFFGNSDYQPISAWHECERLHAYHNLVRYGEIWYDILHQVHPPFLSS
jgi:hypothetical protein